MHAKIEAKLSVSRKAPKDEGARIRDLEKRLAEALEQQTATAKILSVISRSPTDLEHVLEAVAQSASRLCGAANVSLYRVEGSLMRKVAEHGPQLTALRVGETRPIGRTSVSGRAIVDGTTIHVPDHQSAEAAQEYPDARRDTGIRITIGIPLLREGVAIGAFSAYRTESRSFSAGEITLLQTFADQAVIAIENVRLFNETKEALEQQTATSEILRVIASSPTDVRPVFEAILKRAATLCEAQLGHLWLYEGGEQFRLGAGYGSRPDHLQWLQQGLHRFGRPFFRESGPWRVGQVLDVRDTEPYRRGEPVWIRTADHEGMRTLLAAPLVKDGRLVGSIAVYRREVQPFTDQQTALVQTFADQAVIAIENVRLFTELESRNRDLTTALDQRTATAEILRVISSSPTNVQPTFEAIAESATRLCGAVNGLVFHFDGELIHVAAHHNIGDAELDAILSVFPIRPGRGSVAGRAIESRRIVHLEDLAQDPEYEQARVVQAGFRTALSVPMLRGGVPIGTINVMRMAVAPFSPSQIALLQTFADQAVIAIENVRLFTELQEKNQALTEAHAQISEALEQQTATSEILRVIASSPTDLQPVLDALAESASRLCRSVDCNIFLPDGDRLVLRARYGPSRGEADVVGQFVLALVRGTVAGRTVLERRTVHVIDLLAEADEFPEAHQNARRFGFRTMLSVPLIRESAALGVIQLRRTEVNPFTDRQAELLKTFADQAVIAIENARLFLEIEDKSRQLEAASRHKSEFLANMSHELRTPLNAIIGFSEVLSERMFGELNQKQEEYSKDIHASGQHLLSLINDILDLSKIEAGRMELELTDFDLPTAIDNALTLVRERAERRGITLHMSVDERLGEVRADERKIRQVVLNLLSNAIKFTPEGGRIEVAAVPKEGFMEVSVSDTGVGIAPEDQEAIFEEFRQVGTAAKKVEGTGLGLALSRKFVELHGGRIWVKSQTGAGSTFTFAVPIRRGE